MTGIELGRGKRRKVERGLRRQEILQTFLVLCFSFPLLSFFLYQACKLLPSLPFSSALLPTPPPLLPLFAKDGHKMLWTGCKKVIALSPTLTYMYMYTGVRYSWTATTAISLQQPPLQWPTFFGRQSIQSILFQPLYSGHFLLFPKWLLQRGSTVMRKNSQTASFFLCTSWICMCSCSERIYMYMLQVNWFSISSVSWPQFLNN